MVEASYKVTFILKVMEGVSSVSFSVPRQAVKSVKCVRFLISEKNKQKRIYLRGGA